MRPTWADIDLGAVAGNVERLREVAAPAQMCAVVKADGYGHGAVAVARVARDAGADWLAVALVDEGRLLRDAGIGGPILVLSEPRPAEMIEVVDCSLTPTVYTDTGLAAAAAAAGQLDVRLPVHLKIDTGMHRVGADVGDAAMLCDAIAAKPALELEGLWTHCAVADEPTDPYTDEQLDRFESVVDALAAAGHSASLRHAANTAVTIAHPRGRYDMVRCGIGIYGLAPGPALEGCVDLVPAMSIRSQVAFVKTIRAGERVSYGLRWRAGDDTRIATVPVGYADGIRRRLDQVGGEVLIGGRRHPIVGTVTMDQLMVDIGHGGPVAVGDEVVLLGPQGDEEITAAEVARRLDTISYEVVCDVNRRVARRYR